MKRVPPGMARTWASSIFRRLAKAIVEEGASEVRLEDEAAVKVAFDEDGAVNVERLAFKEPT